MISLKKFIKNLKKNKDRIAIKFDNKQVSYGYLLNEINIIIKLIEKEKINVLSILESDKDESYFYSSIIACLIKGITYVPINFSIPKNRLIQIYNLSNSNAIIVGRKNISLKKLKIIRLHKFKDNQIKDNQIKDIKINKTKKDAYIIFTSGSSGLPKGVRISRSALDHYILWIQKKIFNEKNIVCSQFPSIGFDLSVADIFGTLLKFGTLIPFKKKLDFFNIDEILKKNNVSHLICVPSLAEIILSEGRNNEKHCLKKIRKIFFCGEVLKKITLKKIFNINNKINVINAYGPTEATVSCTFKRLNHSNYKKYCNPTASFGKPIKNMKIYLYKPKNNIGELIIEGIQVSRGYINNSKANSKFFKKRQKTCFRTGDICKKINNEFYFLQRIDRQIKNHGYRIELSEIDTYISDITNEISYTVFFKNKLFTFIEKKIRAEILKKKLSNFLPNYMIPTQFIYNKKLPKNINGKIDEKSLIKSLK